MALSGNQKALMQARSGIARAGATRSGYYRANTIITIENDGVPVDVTKYIVYNGWSISLNLNDEVDTATLKLLPTLPFVPKTRSQVRIALGSSSNLQFAGVIVTIQKARITGPDPRMWYDITCIDWMALLDAHLVVAEYPAQSATTTILDIVSRFTRGNITTEGVAPALPVFQAMSIVNERPSTVLRRVTNGIGGGFWIDAERRLRAWSASIPSPIVESTPQPLTDHLSTLKSFRMIEDASQQRTRVWVEGRRTSTLGATPPGPVGGPPSSPLTEAGVFPPTSEVTSDNFVRVGSFLAAGPVVTYNPSVDLTDNPPGALLTAAVAAGGAFLTVADTSVFPTDGWVAAAGQLLIFHKVDATTLQLPGTGYGSLEAPLDAGTQIVTVPYISYHPKDRLAATDPTLPLEDVGSRAQPADSPVVVVIMRDDDDTAATLATREHSDGYYEHIVQDGRYSADGARERALAELANFAQPLVSYEWQTEDLNAEPGRMQHIALVNGTPVTADVRITNVEITPILSNHPPRRSVRATVVQSASVLDVWLDDPR